MCLLSRHHQISSIYLMWKLDNWENGQNSIHFLFPEDSKNFLERLLVYHSVLHPPIHRNRHLLLFIVPGAVLIIYVLAFCNGLSCSFL